jgi:GAF domain-containing protein
MSIELLKIEGSKKEQYLQILPQINGLIEHENDLITNLANITAALKQQFNWWWIGFYLIKNNELVLGPFQGPVACTRIQYGRGVCGTAWKEKKTIIVDDVSTFPCHIACSSFSKSEIVVPVFSNNQIIGVLDVDSEYLQHFDDVDKKHLEEIVKLIRIF